MDIPTYILCTKYTDSKIVSSSTIDIGTVTTLEPNNEATVNNSGTSQDAVFDFAIPRGENGQNGLDGKTPVKGVDYNTPEDIKKIVEEVTKNVIDQTAIKPVKTGELISITDSIEYPFVGLTVYGKSTQDGTPSPENPVPIVSAGDDGSIDLTVSNGASLSQSMTISTPNGLPGIPVDSGGNYTDTSGQQWVCNYADCAERKIHHPIKKYYASKLQFILNKIWTASNNNFAFAYATLTNSNPIAFALSNAFDPIKYTTAVSTIDHPIIMVEAVRGVSVLYVTIEKTVLSEVSSEGINQYLSDIHAEFIAANTNPNETSDMTEEELSAYRALHTYHPNTNVFGTDNVGLSVAYSADYKLYIDNKLKVLQNETFNAFSGGK